MEPAGIITLRLSADRGDGVEIELSHEYATFPFRFDKDVTDVLTYGAAEMLRKYESVKKGTHESS